MSWNQPSPSPRRTLLTVALVPVLYVALFGPALVLNQRAPWFRSAFDRGYVTVFKRLPTVARKVLLDYGSLWLMATGTPPLFVVSDRAHTYRMYTPPANHSAILTEE